MNQSFSSELPSAGKSSAEICQGSWNRLSEPLARVIAGATNLRFIWYQAFCSVSQNPPTLAARTRWSTIKILLRQPRHAPRKLAIASLALVSFDQRQAGRGRIGHCPSFPSEGRNGAFKPDALGLRNVVTFNLIQ